MTIAMNVPDVSVVGRDIKFFSGVSQFVDEGRKVGFDRRIRVPLGMIYVFPDGIYDNQGNNEIYYEGEIVYVSAHKQDSQWHVVKLNRRGARYAIVGNSNLSGITTNSADQATVTMSFTFEVVNPLLILRQYSGRFDQIDDGLTRAIDLAIEPYLNDEIWRMPSDSFLSTLINRANPILENAGIRIVASEAAIKRDVPKIIDTIVAECALAEHRLIDMMDGGRFEPQFDLTLNMQRIAEIEKDPTHSFLDRGDITTFVTGVTTPHAIRGLTFFSVVMHKAKATSPDRTSILYFLARYAGPAVHAFVDNYMTEMASNMNISQLEKSVGIIYHRF